jgi:glutamyl-tRNA synthetase
VGLLKDAAQVVRVLLTGSTRSPELDVVAAILGPDQVKERLSAVL